MGLWLGHLGRDITVWGCYRGPCVTNIPASWQTEGCRGDPGAVCPVGLGNLQKHKVPDRIKGRFEKENIPKSLCSAWVALVGMILSSGLRFIPTDSRVWPVESLSTRIGTSLIWPRVRLRGNDVRNITEDIKYVMVMVLRLTISLKQYCMFHTWQEVRIHP